MVSLSALTSSSEGQGTEAVHWSLVLEGPQCQGSADTQAEVGVGFLHNLFHRALERLWTAFEGQRSGPHLFRRLEEGTHWRDEMGNSFLSQIWSTKPRNRSGNTSCMHSDFKAQSLFLQLFVKTSYVSCPPLKKIYLGKQ